LLGSIGPLGLFVVAAGAQHLPPTVSSADATRRMAPAEVLLRSGLPARDAGQSRGGRPSPLGCALAELSFGLAGEFLGGGGTGAISDVQGLPLVVAAGGAVGGLHLGSSAGGCPVSVVGSLIGASLSVLLGAGAGAFKADRTESEDWALVTVYLFMVPLAWVGGKVGAMISGPPPPPPATGRRDSPPAG
jgi:hypothetical protein